MKSALTTTPQGDIPPEPYEALIYCDGLCEPVNPSGHACYGWVAYGKSGEELAKDSVHIGHGVGMTNNVAEYQAVIRALIWAYKSGRKNVLIRTDSMLIVNQINRLYSCNAPLLQPQLARVRKAQQYVNFTIEWIPREQNTVADELSRYAYAQVTGKRPLERQRA